MKRQILNNLYIITAFVSVVALLPIAAWAAPTSSQQTEKAVSRNRSLVESQSQDNEISQLLNKMRGSEGAVAQPSKRRLARITRKNGDLRSLGTPAGHYFLVSKTVAGNPTATAKNFIDEQRMAFGVVSDAVDFSLKRSRKRNGLNFERFGQTYSQIPVYGAETLIQLNDAGGVEFAVSDIMRDTSLLDSGTVSTVPAISANDAELSAIALMAQEYPDIQLESTELQLMIYQPEVVGNFGQTRLVWHTVIKSVPVYLVDEVVLVDAHTGEVVLHYSRIINAKDRAIYDADGEEVDPGTLVRSEGEPPIGIPDADECYDFLGDTYDFYANEHGRDGIDDAGMTMMATVRYPYNNAQWLGDRMRYGTGWATDDVVAHELTHGVTQHESGLIYLNESGAINESFSDMWGEWVDLVNGAGNDSPSVRWLMGEDTVFGAIRDMANPPAFGDPDSKCSPFWYEGEDDNGGVHINSGVGNKLCYLLTDGDIFMDVEITGMGISTAADLFYEVQTNLLTMASDYADLHIALTQAAINLGWSENDRYNLEKACLITELSKCFDPNDIIDTLAPQPDPAEWASTGLDQWGKPKATGLNTIAMEAQQATDIGDVEYYFECVTDSDFDSDWQSGAFYAVTGLTSATEYTFHVRARDDANNYTGWSVESSATTGSGAIDPCSPFPDPPIWDAKPQAIRLTPLIITMRAKVASDESGVEYYFAAYSSPAAVNLVDERIWQDDTVWRPSSGSFTIGNTYYFRFMVHDQSSNQNETDFSSLEALTLRLGPRTLPVPSHYPTIQAGIDAATNAGDVVVVSPDLYTGPGNVDLVFRGVPITVRSLDPNDQSIIDSTIIDGLNADRAFNFTNGEDANYIVAGFTIRNGTNEGADGDPGDPCGPTPAGDGHDGEGGGMICNSGSPTIYNCVFEGCQAIGGNGGDPNGAEGGDAGSGFGGGIYADGSSNPTILGCTFTGCLADDGNSTGGLFGEGSGGGIYLAHGSEAIIEDCSVSGCSARGNNQGRGLGGGIYHGLAGTNVSITNTQVFGLNVASNDGGGIYFAAGGSGVTLSNCEISSNVANDSGGGIYYVDGHTLVIKDSSRILNNQCLSSSGRGGGIFAGDIAHPGTTSVEISNSLVTDNTATFGGGIYMDETHLDAVDSEFSSNSSSEGGGLNGAWCDINLVRCDISDNNAVTGSGLGGGMAFWNTPARMVDCLVQRNDAVGGQGIGGGVYFSGYDNNPKKLINCLITDNKADREGAGLFCHMGVWADVNNCTIADNSVTGSIGSGGGLSCAESISYVRLTNSIVYGNQAPDGPQIAVGRITGSGPEPDALVDVVYSNVQGGEGDVFEEGPYTVVYFLGGNWDEDNPFVSIDVNKPSYFLRHLATGQSSDSNLVDGGLGLADDLATEVGMSLTTRTDGVEDTNTVDIGYHYQAEQVPDRQYQLTIRVAHHPDFDADGKLTAEGFGFDTFSARNEPNSQMIGQGVEVLLTADPDVNFVVFEWEGADIVPNTGEPDNIVTMNSNKEVVVSFEPSEGWFYLFTEVDTGNGRIDYINSQGQQEEHPGRTIHSEGEIVEIFAVPDNPVHVPRWNGTDNDESIAKENTATMDDNRYVTASFIEPRILYVPGEYTNIQTAIDDAEDGDIIIIAPGSYRRFIDSGSPYSIVGKQITLTGSDPEDPCVVAATILNTGIWVLDVGRTCRIEGLTFRDINYFWYRPGFDGGTEENPYADGENGFPAAGSALILHDSYFAGGHIGNPLPRDPQPGSSPDISNCVFLNCSTTGRDGGAGAVVDEMPGDGGWGGWAHGGAVSLGADSNPRFRNCQFINCFARGGNGGNGTEDPDGRGGLWDLTDLLEFGWTFGPYEEFFKYSGFGGAVFVDVNSAPEFIDCNFVNCQAYGGTSGIGGGTRWPDQHWRINRFGGAVYCADESSATFTRCSFSGNTADVNGPAQWDWNSWHSSATEDASSDDDFLSYGGAVAFEDSANVTFIQCDFNDNTATIGGAAYWNWSDPTFDDCNFVDNSAFHGGGILCVGGSGLIENCRFTGNSATIEGGQGGAIASLGANTEIIDTQIVANYAQTSGGGLYISSKDFDGNDVASWNMVTVNNCLIAENTAGLSGAGISSNWYAFTDIDLCTIANNLVLEDGYGGGLYSSYGNYTVVENSIFWGNNAANGRQIAVRPAAQPAAVAVDFSDVQGGDVYVQPPSTGGSVWVDQGCLYQAGDDNIGANAGDDPLFVSGLMGDYYLSQTATEAQGQNEDSPCVDAGSGPASSFEMDIKTTRTDEVPDRGVVDMGYHYPLSSVAARCKFCDIAPDGRINFADFAAFGLRWFDQGCSEDNDWCGGADFNFDGAVNSGDVDYFSNCWLVVDDEPPMPNPMQWRIAPHSTSQNNIDMGAALAYDAWGGEVEYLFDCSDHAHDRGWDIDPNYEDSGLTIGIQYAYKVKARDQWGNETEFSVTSGAVAGEDNTAPTPNPMTWAILPQAVSANSISMIASQATDSSGVEYGFWNLDTGVIVWQNNREFLDEGLDLLTEYTYRAAARDKSINQNITAWSVPASATTDPNDPNGGGLDFDPPETGGIEGNYKAAFAIVPDEVLLGDGYHHQMTAVEATDATEPVQYRFICVSDSRFSSDWQEDTYYDVLVATQSRSSWIWQVVTRDSASPTPNVGDLSDYWNCRGQTFPYP